MHLVQLLLPLYNGKAEAFPSTLYEQVKKELSQQFGGLTAYTGSPASGIWKDGEKIVKDDIYVYEIMLQEIDKNYWATYKSKLQLIFEQEELIIRVSDITLL